MRGRQGEKKCRGMGATGYWTAISRMCCEMWIVMYGVIVPNGVGLIGHHLRREGIQRTESVVRVNGHNRGSLLYEG